MAHKCEYCQAEYPRADDRDCHEEACPARPPTEEPQAALERRTAKGKRWPSLKDLKD